MNTKNNLFDEARLYQTHKTVFISYQGYKIPLKEIQLRDKKFYLYEPSNFFDVPGFSPLSLSVNNIYEVANKNSESTFFDYLACREQDTKLTADGKIDYSLKSRIIDDLRKGHAVCPKNKNHKSLYPIIIGKNFRTKINANIGTSKIIDSVDKEVNKIRWALRYGADTIMDLSASKNISKVRKKLISNCPVPFGTVPIYEAFEKVGQNPAKLTWNLFKDVLIEQAEDGVDYFTLHAGILKDYVPLTKSRLTGIVSKGGGILAHWMSLYNKENFIYTHFDEVLEICKQYEITISLGDALRPGSTHDACDRAQFSELKTLGELQKRAYKKGVQVMIEGPGHVPLNRLQENFDKNEEYCNGAPFYTLGPLVTDIASGWDHLNSAIGAASIGQMGTALLCYVTPKEHLGLPDETDIKEGLIAYRIAAHSADLANNHSEAVRWADEMSLARYEFRWDDQFSLSIDPEKARSYHDASLPADSAKKSKFCSMCGPKYCPMNLHQNLGL